MDRMVITNVQVWDGTGAEPFPGEVLIEGNRIAEVARGSERIDRSGAAAFDGAGGTLMPGLVEGHAHPSFAHTTTLSAIGEIPPEEHTLITMHHVRKMLEAGFTSIFCAASAKPRLDVVVRNEIEAGRIPGPRMRAASPEITVTGGLGDERLRHLHRESFAIIADGVDEVRRVVRETCRDGVDTVKINISGDDFVPHCKGEQTVMTDAEIATAVETAHSFGRRAASHSRSTLAVKKAVQHGVDVIYHCEFADESALDALESVKDKIFVGPAIGILHNTSFEAAEWGITSADAEKLGLRRAFDLACETYHKMRERGIRVVIGGDYGFAWTPIGTNARDIGHFVKYFGYSPTEALMAATKVGGELMGHPGELGLIVPGAFADVLVVAGDPLADVGLLADHAKLAAIVKDGVFYKNTLQPARTEVAVGV
jgi:imidazolonepropionase-like amidohydrolase